MYVLQQSTDCKLSAELVFLWYAGGEEGISLFLFRFVCVESEKKRLQYPQITIEPYVQLLTTVDVVLLHQWLYSSAIIINTDT